MCHVTFPERDVRAKTWFIPLHPHCRSSSANSSISWEWMDDRMWARSEVKSLSRARLSATPWIVACPKLLHPWDFHGKSTGVGCYFGKSTGVGCYFLLQGIFPTQGLNPGLSHCRQTLYHLSHQGSKFCGLLSHVSLSLPMDMVIGPRKPVLAWPMHKWSCSA